MSVLNLVIAPDPLLQQVSTPVEKITDEIKNLCKDMLDTMYASHGIGLSAVQIGILKRIIVVDVKWPELERPSSEQYIMINPKIIENSKIKNDYNEGCLSFPNEQVKITRPKVIMVKYLDENATEHTIQADELLATCIQHEIDHLNGITISSYVSPLKKQMMMNRLKKIKSTHNAKT